MALDDILKEHAAWLEKAARQPIFQKVQDRDINFPQELRDRRATEIAEAIGGLNRQRETSDARFAAAIQGYEKELEALKAPTSDGAPVRPRVTGVAAESKIARQRPVKKGKKQG